MDLTRTLDQHIAVFGESGSGKTVLLSSFYGATQEAAFTAASPFRVVAEDPGQGTRLHQNYLGMKREARTPTATRFAQTSYPFLVKLKKDEAKKSQGRRPIDALRLVWHDYPGEWFEEGPTSGAEAERRVSTFRSLLRSDVALFLVDAQRLIDNAGEEERYLKSLFTNFKNGLLLLQDDLLENGKPLTRFPRIWVIALSKADLLPGFDAPALRETVIGKAGAEVNALREVLGEFVEGNQALALGEDFVLLSSAKFEPGTIETARQIGINLILPLASMLPLERKVRWAKTKRLPGQLAEQVFGAGRFGAHMLASALLGKWRLPGPLGIVQALAGTFLPNSAIDDAFDLGGEKLKALNAKALADHNYLTATLTGLKLQLELGEQQRVLLRSDR